MDLHEIFNDFLLRQGPSLFSLIGKSTITTIAHFRVPIIHPSSDLVPVFFFTFSQLDQHFILFFSPTVPFVVVSSFNEIFWWNIKLDGSEWIICILAPLFKTLLLSAEFRDLPYRLCIEHKTLRAKRHKPIVHLSFRLIKIINSEHNILIKGPNL